GPTGLRSHPDHARAGRTHPVSAAPPGALSERTRPAQTARAEAAVRRVVPITSLDGAPAPTEPNTSRSDNAPLWGEVAARMQHGATRHNPGRHSMQLYGNQIRDARRRPRRSTTSLAREVR